MAIYRAILGSKCISLSYKNTNLPDLVSDYGKESYHGDTLQRSWEKWLVISLLVQFQLQNEITIIKKYITYTK